jgi:hypothetical protein
LVQDIQSLVEEAALRQPLLICLGDLQWASSGFVLAMRQLPLSVQYSPVGEVRPALGAEPGFRRGTGLSALFLSDLGRFYAESRLTRRKMAQHTEKSTP